METLAAEHGQTDAGTHPEQGDEHTELDVGRVQDVPHEDDSQREEGADAKGDREGGRRHRPHEGDAKGREEPARPVVLQRSNSPDGLGSETADPAQQGERDQVGGGVHPERRSDPPR